MDSCVTLASMSSWLTRPIHASVSQRRWQRTCRTHHSRQQVSDVSSLCYWHWEQRGSVPLVWGHASLLRTGRARGRLALQPEIIV